VHVATLEVPLVFWIGFLTFVFTMLALDLGVFNRKAHTVSVREAGIWTSVWVSLALLFNVGLYYVAGPQVGLEFLTGYLIEYSLSVDNIFVFVLIFSAFAVPSQYQHRVLFWGILGALLMRGIMIAVGAALIENFHWIIYVFGAFLVFAGVRMFFSSEGETVDLEKNIVLRFIRRLFPVTDGYREAKFTVVEQGRRMVTPLLLVLVMIELTDLVFALDSIPAIFAITQEPFIVFTSNIFAILGLRSLYFLLAGIIHKFVYLRYGLAFVLTFVGVKMLVEYFDVHIPILVSLGVIISALAVSIIASLLSPRSKDPEREVEHVDVSKLPESPGGS
jgi:tellurite resistance protein TerC